MKTPEEIINDRNPVCLVHGKKLSEHDCLFCCLCFKPLVIEQCNTNAQGQKEDVCKECAEIERKHDQPNNR